MRTTLNIQDDAFELARAHARRRSLKLGEAVSELIRRGAQQPLLTTNRQGLTVVNLPENSPKVTSEQVSELMEEIP